MDGPKSYLNKVKEKDLAEFFEITLGMEKPGNRLKLS